MQEVIINGMIFLIFEKYILFWGKRISKDLCRGYRGSKFWCKKLNLTTFFFLF